VLDDVHDVFVIDVKTPRAISFVGQICSNRPSWSKRPAPDRLAICYEDAPSAIDPHAMRQPELSGACAGSPQDLSSVRRR
jgi:hypothetical protein